MKSRLLPVANGRLRGWHGEKGCRKGTSLARKESGSGENRKEENGGKRQNGPRIGRLRLRCQLCRVDVNYLRRR